MFPSRQLRYWYLLLHVIPAVSDEFTLVHKPLEIRLCGTLSVDIRGPTIEPFPSSLTLGKMQSDITLMHGGAGWPTTKTLSRVTMEGRPVVLRLVDPGGWVGTMQARLEPAPHMRRIPRGSCGVLGEDLPKGLIRASLRYQLFSYCCIHFVSFNYCLTSHVILLSLDHRLENV